MRALSHYSCVDKTEKLESSLFTLCKFTHNLVYDKLIMYLPDTSLFPGFCSGLLCVV